MAMHKTNILYKLIRQSYAGLTLVILSGCGAKHQDIMPQSFEETTMSSSIKNDVNTTNELSSYKDDIASNDLTGNEKQTITLLGNKSIFLQKIQIINGLMWQDDKVILTNRMDWINSKKYCESLRLLNYNDWRIPTIVELQDAFVMIRGNKKRGFDYNTDQYYWSNTKEELKMYAFFSKTGKGYAEDKESEFFIRCVRNIN